MRTRRFPLFLVCCGVLVLTTGLAACSDDNDTSSIPVYHEGDPITVKKGNEFVIALAANPSTGYTWDAGDNPNVELVSSKQVSANSGLAGAPGTQQMTLKATKTGSSTLELAYARHFEGGVPPARTASFEVTVT